MLHSISTWGLSPFAHFVLASLHRFIPSVATFRTFIRIWHPRFPAIPTDERGALGMAPWMIHPLNVHDIPSSNDRGALYARLKRDIGHVMGPSSQKSPSAGCRVAGSVDSPRDIRGSDWPCPDCKQRQGIRYRQWRKSKGTEIERFLGKPVPRYFAITPINLNANCPES